MNKISFCTICMNRLSHLKETLPANIRENKNYPNVEFVVLDYNSQDGMEDWMRSNMNEYIESGLLKYYKTYEPLYFNISHSKNMISLLSSGDLIAFVDADNYAGENYVDWLAATFAEYGNNTVITTLRKTHIPFRDQGGKLCCCRDLFKLVRGFDESLVGYGIDDVDLVNRLERAGGNRVFIENPDFLRYIGHTNEERMNNYALFKDLENIYLQRSDFREVFNTILYLFKDSTFLHVEFEFIESMKEDLIATHSGWRIKDNGHERGSFGRTPDGLTLNFDNKKNMLCQLQTDGLLHSVSGEENILWDNIRKDNVLYTELIMGYGECLNRMKYKENEVSLTSTNQNGYGKGIAYLNFNRAAPIRVEMPGRTFPVDRFYSDKYQ
ncbi:MAG TPA: glycosyltransferase family A protein [Puia sp.]